MRVQQAGEAARHDEAGATHQHLEGVKHVACAALVEPPEPLPASVALAGDGVGEDPHVLALALSLVHDDGRGANREASEAVERLQDGRAALRDAGERVPVKLAVDQQHVRLSVPLQLDHAATKQAPPVRQLTAARRRRGAPPAPSAPAAQSLHSTSAAALLVHERRAPRRARRQREAHSWPAAVAAGDGTWRSAAAANRRAPCSGGSSTSGGRSADRKTACGR